MNTIDLAHANGRKLDLAALAKANNDVYLAAYRAGYEAGWTAAMRKAVEIIESPAKVTQGDPTR